ncbi:hypothetical protein DL766_003411 [Monosporascus sp. MC13-8B]|uniref:G-patch domain-containing protein n=1 Tax=Monosporascus cannonballus TaxID=155416 RepID=A0ABY0HJF3_9PEZI|nr:hypothetical protein DL763_011563 [Monosporascus cannonballus]RYO92763.1 hypothetical protein DL762_001469 [Monosporascus cannonballus]RYP33491.1 hypothetical protein DL766_003411 [Monosporascus sp. MC13-8B]
MSFDPSRISKADAEAYSSSDDDRNDDDEILHASVDPREDEFLDYNPRKRRKTGRDAKESAALGIFGSDSEDDGPARRWKSKQNLRHKNMTFVSGGRKQRGNDTDGDEDEKEDDDDDDEDAYGRRPGLGTKAAPEQEEDDEADEDEDEEMAGVRLGFRPAAQGLGRAPPVQSRSFQATSTPNKPPRAKAKYDGSTPLGRGFVPSSANEPVLREDLKEAPTPAPQTPKPSAFGGGGGKGKSFAAKMMAKMGYVEGQGLGANNQGRATSIQAMLRPQGNLGLGAVKEKSEHERKEEKRQARLRGEEVSDSDEEKKRKKREKKRQGLDSGTGSGASTPRRPKTKYLTVNDIRKAAPGLHIPDAFAPILDLTGRDQKLLTSSSGLLTPTAGTDAVKHSEAGKLARRAQGDLGAFVEEWKNLQEKKAWLDMQIRECEQALDELETDFSGLEAFNSILDDVSEAARSREWDPVISGLRNAEAAGANHDEDLAAIAVASIHPFMRDAVQGWQPLDDPKLGNFTSDLADIRGLLGLENKAANGRAVTKWEDTEIDGTHRHHQRATTPYESMIYKYIFPKLVTTISGWDVCDPAPLLAVFDKWERLFPSFIRSQLLEQVARRLSDAVGSWKSRKKQQPLHLWVFPWLEHLPAYHLDPRGTGLVADVRRKFRQLIDAWDYHRGTVAGLKEWKNVLRPSGERDQWKPLVLHHMLPSMARYLRTQFRVDPVDQEPYMEMLSGVLRWTEIISPSMVAEVIAAEVFSQWQLVLWEWLTSSEANYEEIGAWFEWWQNEVFPAEISSSQTIAAEFAAGNAMIEKALDLGDEAKDKLPRPEAGPAHRPRSRGHGKPKPAATPLPPPPPQSLDNKPEPTFRDEVEEWCQDNDLQFIPVRRTNDQGKHYFRITARLDGKGGVLAYFTSEPDVLHVESRKMDMRLARDRRDEWGLLLGKLYEEA